MSANELYEGNIDGMLRVIHDVSFERGRQLQKFGVQNWEPRDWLMILAEEVGEANREALEARFANLFPEHYTEDAQRMQRLRAELIQVAAVAVAAVESLDRNELKDANPTI
jgi:hypothetical protein